MSAKLLLSINTRLVMNPAIVIVMTKASSYGWWISLASSSLKVIIWSSNFAFFCSL